MEMSKAHLTMVSKLHYQTVFLGEFSQSLLWKKKGISHDKQDLHLVRCLDALDQGRTGRCVSVFSWAVCFGYDSARD